MKALLSENNWDVVGSDEITGKKKRLALLDTLILASENFTKLSKKEIQEEVDTFLFAGHDTTGLTLSWALFLLSKNPEWQNKVQHEVDELFGTSSQRPVNLEDLRNLKLMECCIKETLRMFSTVPFIARDLENDLDMGEFTLKKGTGILVLIDGVHHNPEHFVDPHSFRPDRFFTPMPDELVPPKPHNFAFVPFAAGQRNCIGQRFAMTELKIILAHFFRKFDVLPSGLNEDEEPFAIMELLLKPLKGEIPVKIKHRSFLTHS